MAIDTEERNSAKPNGKGGNSNKKVLIIVLAVVGALILLGIAGTIAAGYIFKEATEKTIETATGSQVDLNSDGTGEVTFKGDNGDKMKIATETKVPDGFPAAVPLYDNGKVVHAQTTTAGDEGTSYTVISETDDSLSQVDDFYTNALSAEKGWKNTSKTASGEYVQLTSANKSKDLVLILSIMPDSETGKTRITVITRNQTEQ